MMTLSNKIKNMKGTAILCLLLFLHFLGRSQQANPNGPLPKTDYLQKSKKQKTAAWILLGGGATVGFIGLASINLAGTDDPDGVNNTPGTILFATGLASMIASIPMFSAAKKNKRKAMSVSLKNQFLPYLQNTSIVCAAIPSVHIKITL